MVGRSEERRSQLKDVSKPKLIKFEQENNDSIGSQPID